MKKWMQEAGYFLKNRIFMLVLSLTAVGSYGYLLTHQTVGMDDTPYNLYFQEGLSAVVGRWVIYLLNKVLFLGEFGPFLTDLAGVLFLGFGAIVFCVLIRRILGEKVPFYGYVFFACFLVANPLWAEVFPYYLHNAVGLGTLLTGFSLTLFFEGAEKKKKANYVFSALLLWLAIGCYESFMIAWLTAFLLLSAFRQDDKRKQRVFLRLLLGAGVMAGAVLLRMLWIPVVVKVCGLEELKSIAGQRSMAEMISWVSDAEKRAEFVMGAKKAYVMYGAFAYAYYPIFLFVLSAFVLMITGIAGSIRRKEAWTVLLTIGAFISCFLLVFIEGKATPYRAAQFLPVICGMGVIAFTKAVETLAARIKAKKGRIWSLYAVQGCAVLILSVFLFNQCADMNRWFYVDDLKYQAAKETAGRVAFELAKNYDTSKPVIFTGIYDIPESIIRDAYVPYGTETYYKLRRVTDPIDPHLLEKFNRPQGVWVVQTPIFSVIEWGRTAFDNNKELAIFFEMHGYHFQPVMDLDRILAAQELAVSMELPEFPREGSIQDMGEYIIVNL